MGTRKHFLVFGTVISSLIGTSAAWAQVADAGSDVLDEIVVTARKREETVTRIPEIVAVIGDEALEQRNVTNLSGMQAMIPAFSFNQFQDPGVVYMSVRGINSVRNSENPVAFVVDGVQSNDATQINQELTDIERVEFLKGPQGSLYGRNAIGGAINIVTRKPTDELSGSFKFTYKNGNERNFQASLSGPIVEDKLWFRVGGTTRNYDGLIVNETLKAKADASQDENIFGKLYYNPTENTRFELRGSHFYGTADAYYFKKVGLGMINREDEFPVIETPQGLTERRFDDVSLKAEFDLGSVTLTSVSAYSHNLNLLDGDLAISPEADGQLGEKFDNRAFNQDLKLASNGDGPLQWVAGAYYLHKKQHAVNPVYLGPALIPGAVLPRDLGIRLGDFFKIPEAPGTVLISRKDFDFTNKAYAAYAQGNYDLSDEVTITLGLRYDRERRLAYNRGSLAYDFTQGKAVPVAPAQDVAKNRANTYSAWQPKLSIAYKPDANNLLYTTVSRGFRSGGFNNTTRADFATYPAESLWNYEVGAKSTMLGGKLIAEAAAFYMDDKNRSDFFFYVIDSTQNLFPIAKSRIYGIESSLTARLSRDLTLSAGLSLLDSKILKIDASKVDPNPNRTGLGKHLSYVYHTQFNASAKYTRAITEEVEALFGLDFSLKADNWFWYSNDGFKQEAIPLFDARIALVRGPMEVKVFAENLFNFSYVTSHDPNFAFGFDQDDAYPATPRRYGVSLSYKF